MMRPDSRNIGNMIRESLQLTATAMLLTVSLALPSGSPHRYVELVLDVFRLSIIAGTSSDGLHSFRLPFFRKELLYAVPYFSNRSVYTQERSCVLFCCN
jgi:hypothetical protein